MVSLVDLPAEVIVLIVDKISCVVSFRNFALVNRYISCILCDSVVQQRTKERLAEVKHKIYENLNISAIFKILPNGSYASLPFFSFCDWNTKTETHAENEQLHKISLVQWIELVLTGEEPFQPLLLCYVTWITAKELIWLFHSCISYKSNLTAKFRCTQNMQLARDLIPQILYYWSQNNFHNEWSAPDLPFNAHWLCKEHNLVYKVDINQKINEMDDFQTSDFPPWSILDIPCKDLIDHLRAEHCKKIPCIPLAQYLQLTPRSDSFLLKQQKLFDFFRFAILRCETIEHRTLVFVKLIDTAYQSLAADIPDYNIAILLYSVLNCPSIYRLRRTKAFLQNYENMEEKYNYLEEVCESHLSFNGVIEDMKQREKYIPYPGVLLTKINLEYGKLSNSPHRQMYPIFLPLFRNISDLLFEIEASNRMLRSMQGTFESRQDIGGWINQMIIICSCESSHLLQMSECIEKRNQENSTEQVVVSEDLDQVWEDVKGVTRDDVEYEAIYCSCFPNKVSVREAVTIVQRFDVTVAEICLTRLFDKIQILWTDRKTCFSSNQHAVEYRNKAILPIQCRTLFLLTFISSDKRNQQMACPSFNYFIFNRK